MREALGNVVPFERPASYWVHRARRYRAPAQLPDAARLMRKALSTQPDPALQLELAQIYMGMSCFTAAERCLLQAISQGNLTGGACFLIGECALAGDDEDLARRAFEWCLRLDPDGAYAPYAQAYLEDYSWAQGEYLPRGARGEYHCRRAQRALTQGDIKQARQMARKAWRQSPSCQAALLMGAMAKPRDAVDYFSFVARRRPAEGQPLLLLAHAHYLAGDGYQARETLQRALDRCRALAQCEAFCMMAWQMGASDLALELLEQRLKPAPSSADLWRMKYLTLKNLHREDEAAQALETLLEMDPEDAAGLWYRVHSEDIRPYEGRNLLLHALGEGFSQMPLPREKSGPLNRTLHLMVMTLSPEMDAQTIYHFLPPLWRKLSPQEKDICDRREKIVYPMALAIYLLLMAGEKQRAGEMLAAAPERKRLLRLLKKFAHRMEKGEN